MRVSELFEFISRYAKVGVQSWVLEKLPRKRLLKKMAVFSCYLLALGTGGISLYVVKRLSVDANLQCLIWNLDATSLAPYQGGDQGSEAFYWLFTFLAVLLNMGFLHYVVHTRQDKLSRESRVILATLHRMFLQCGTVCGVHTGSCIDNWKDRMNWKKRYNVWWPCKWIKWTVFHTTNALLHLLVIALLSIPGFAYLIAQSVGSYGVLKLFSNATVVSISGILLKSFLYRVATLLARFRQWFYLIDAVADRNSLPLVGVRFNLWRTKSMFIITWAVDIVAPIACIMAFDESCLRYYLKFSPSISAVMGYWDIGQTGFEAYRTGFCLQKLVNVFSPVWCTTACLSVFVSPTKKMWLSTPARLAIAWLSQWWKQRCGSGEPETGVDTNEDLEVSIKPNMLTPRTEHEWQDEADSVDQMEEVATSGDKVIDCQKLSNTELDQLVEQQVDELQNRIMEQTVDITELLNQVAIASSFGLLVPALFFFVALTIPAWLLAIECIALMESGNKASYPSIQRMLVAYPKSFASNMYILSAWTVVHFLLFDFGFPLGCWALFELSCVGLVLGMKLWPKPPLTGCALQVIDFKCTPSYENVIQFRSEQPCQVL